MSLNTTLVRTRRPKRRARLTLSRGLMAALLVAALTAVAFYYATRYVEDMDFARYPLMYKAEIIEAAHEFALDPAHVAAVVMCESSFRPGAVSSVGALGLMQIMPETGRWISGKFNDIEVFSTESLSDPALNLRFGCWYLKWLLDRYQGDMTCATAAYHAGQGSVDKWLLDPEHSADGSTLINIPIRETSIYTQRVLKAYEKYKALYSFGA